MAKHRVTRSLGAILAIDAVGYSRQMARDEEATLKTLQAYRAAIAGLVARHGGRVFGVAGDSEMAVLPHALEALACARDIEQAIEALNAELPAERRMPLRLGIHFGKVLIEGDHVFGDDVNVAARVEDLAGKGGICLSGAAFDRVQGRLPLGFEDYGPQKFKNMDRPVRVYRLRDEPLMAGRVVPGRPPRARARRRWAAALAALAALVVAGAGLWTLYLQERIADSQRLAAEHAAATAAAQDRAERLGAALQEAEARAQGERNRAAELVTALRAAERAAATHADLVTAAERREAGRLAQEAARAETLIAALAQAEARAEAERQKAQGLLGALHAAEAQTTAALDRAEREQTAARAAERQRAAALLASWRAAERQAVAERERVEALLAGLRGAEDQALAERARAEDRAAARSQAARARAGERARAEELLTALAGAERKAAAELRKGEALMASLEGTEGAPERGRVQALLATWQEAGQTAATERKRAELLIASWETPKAGTAGEDVGAARHAAETRAAERARAEALLATWRDAEATAASERARAEALLDALREAEAQAQDHADEGAAETEALTPTRPDPEDGASAPARSKQLAALPGRPEGTDALLSQLGGGSTAPAGGEASLEAVERLLRERREDFETVLDSYLMHKWADPKFSLTRIPGGNKHFRFWDFKVMGRGSDGYDVRVIFESRTPATWGMGAQRLIVSLRVDGGDFQIVGHRSLSSGEGREAALDQAPATPEQVAAMDSVERLLQERKEAFRTVLQAYLARNQTQNFGSWIVGRISRLWQTEVLGAEDDTYRIRVLYYTQDGQYERFGDIVVFLKIDGEDFEIVGHRSLSAGEGREAAVDQAPATPEQQAAMEAIERLLQERAEAFRRVLQAYLVDHIWSEQFGGRDYRWVSDLRQTEVLGAEDDTYRISALFYTRWGAYRYSGDIVVFLKIDGEDFEIVRHEFLSVAAE